MFLFCSVGGTYHGTLLTLPQLANRHVTSPPTALHDGVPLAAATMIVVKPPAESYLDDGTDEAPPVHLSAYLHMIGIGEDPAGKKKKVGAPLSRICSASWRVVHGTVIMSAAPGAVVGQKLQTVWTVTLTLDERELSVVHL